MTPRGPVRYSTNLIRTLRSQEAKSEQRQRLTAIFAIGGFTLLSLAVVFAALNIWSMAKVLTVETQNLDRLKQEYQKYTVSKDIIDKADIELLDNLQTSNIFWSKKLAVLGRHLPAGCSLTDLRFQDDNLQVTGIAQSLPDQNELLVLEKYLQDLRTDPNFNQHFSSVRLTTASRHADGAGSVAFDFVAQNRNKRAR
jgi:Tfp pilus assembly protein PilN